MFIILSGVFNMIYGLWTNNGALNSGPVFDAFAKGVEKTGGSVVYNSESCDVDVIWSVLWRGRMAPNKLIWDSANQTKKPVVVLEVGLIKRNHTWRIGLNGIGEMSRFFPLNNGPERKNALGLKNAPWTKNGNNILICCQNSNSELWKNKPTPIQWVKDTITEIRKYSDKQIIIRPHPRSPLSWGNIRGKNILIQKPIKVEKEYPINFNNIHATINLNSNPGVESVLSGVPVFCDSTSLAASVGNFDISKIETPLTPDTDQWSNDLCYTEFTTDEISSGWPIESLTNKIRVLY